MRHRGRLTRDRLGYSMPPTSPLFSPPSIVCTNVESLGITFETDPDAAAELLPEPLELAEPALATIGVMHIPEGALAAYDEALLVLHVLWEGRPYRYDVQFLVTNDLAMAFGREVLGAPKKLGNVVLERSAEGVFGYAERPAGYRLFSLGMSLEKLEAPGAVDLKLAPSVCLRIIGQPEEYETDTTMELLETSATRKVHEVWSGKGSISFPKLHSQIDDWGILPVRRIVGATFTRLDVDMPRPKLLTRM